MAAATFLFFPKTSTFRYHKCDQTIQPIWQVFNMMAQGTEKGGDWTVEPRSGTSAQPRRQSVPFALPDHISHSARNH